MTMTTTAGITTVTTRLASTDTAMDIRTASSAASTIVCRDTAITTRAACGKTPAVTSAGWARAAATNRRIAAGMRGYQRGYGAYGYRRGWYQNRDDYRWHDRDDWR